MPSWSVAVTSAETGPGVREQISAITSAIRRPDLATRLGLVVTPSTSPASVRERISEMSAVSTKNFIGGLASLDTVPGDSRRAAADVVSVSFGARIADGPGFRKASAARSTAADVARAPRVRVLLPLPLAGAYDYRVPPESPVQPGDFVVAPLNRKELIGVVWDGLGNLSEPPLPDARLKPIVQTLPVPPDDRQPPAVHRLGRVLHPEPAGRRAADGDERPGGAGAAARHAGLDARAAGRQQPAAPDAGAEAGARRHGAGRGLRRCAAGGGRRGLARRVARDGR